jgi:hypothetical protein
MSRSYCLRGLSGRERAPRRGRIRPAGHGSTSVALQNLAIAGSIEGKARGRIMRHGILLPSASDPQQRAQIAALVGRFAGQLIELRPAQRIPVVYIALSRLRTAYRESYLQDRTARLHCDNFVDSLEDWIWRTVRILEPQEATCMRDAVASGALPSRPVKAKSHLVPGDYRRRAQQCRDQAARAGREEHRLAWRERAEYWDALAMTRI